MFPDSSAAIFFPCDCLAEHSHLPEGERRRWKPGPEQLQQPAHESLPGVAMANSLGNVAAQAFISGLRILVGEIWYLEHGGLGCGSLAQKVAQTSCCWRSQATVSSEEKLCSPPSETCRNRPPGMTFKVSNAHLTSSLVNQPLPV